MKIHPRLVSWVLLGAFVIPIAGSAVIAVVLTVRWVANPQRPDPFARAVETYGTGPDIRGDSRELVIQMIGQPAATDLFPEWHMVYPLGTKRTSTDSKQDWLVIRLDGGVVTETAVIRR